MKRIPKPIVEVQKLNTGEMRNQIKIQEYDSENVNENGYPEPNWVTKHHLWAKIKTVKGSEVIKAAAEINTETYRFIVRYTEGLNAKQRIVFKNHIYDIQAVLNDDELQNTQTIIAVVRKS